MVKLARFASMLTTSFLPLKSDVTAYDVLVPQPKASATVKSIAARTNATADKLGVPPEVVLLLAFWQTEDPAGMLALVMTPNPAILNGATAWKGFAPPGITKANVGPTGPGIKPTPGATGGSGGSPPGGTGTGIFGPGPSIPGGSGGKAKDTAGYTVPGGTGAGSQVDPFDPTSTIGWTMPSWKASK